MKPIFMSLILVFSSSVFASQNLQFNSTELKNIVAEFEKISPELVQNGKVTVSYCGGSPDAETELKKLSMSDLSTKVLIDSNDIQSYGYMLRGVSSFKTYDEMDTFMSKLDDYTLNNGLLTFTAYTIFRNGSVNYGVLSGVVINDKRTDEYLFISGYDNNNDCD
jgi:hypothetical protein